MVERTGVLSGHDITTCPDVSVLSTVHCAADGFLALDSVYNLEPLIFAVRTEMERGIRYGVSVVMHDSGVCVVTVCPAECRIIVMKTDMFGSLQNEFSDNHILQNEGFEQKSAYPC